MKTLALLVLASIFAAGSAAAQTAPLPPPPPMPPAALAPSAYPLPPPVYYPAPEAPPSSGLGLLIPGAILTGVGVVNLATAPICESSAFPSNIQDVCLDASLVVGGVFLAVGVPLLVVGISKRGTYNDWKQAHPVMTGLAVAPTPGGALGSWQATF